MQFDHSKELNYDIISLGEVMLRLDPGDGRIRNARSFTVWEGGGEYNVSRAFVKCFKKRSAIITSLVANEIGYLVKDLIMQGGVNTELIHWLDFDGSGKSSRNGIYFLEKGFGVRGALGCSDRGNTAISQLRHDNIDWEYVFGQLGSKWFHTGGIFAGLSENAPKVIVHAMKSAKKYGAVISYDLNYRASLWESMGGYKAAQKINKEIVKYVDVLFGNEEDFTACLGFEVEGVSKNLEKLPTQGFKKMISRVTKDYPNLKVIGTTLRKVIDANTNGWGAIAWSKKDGFSESFPFPELKIYDRVGGGDGFASGFIYGLLENMDFDTALKFGIAHGALAMTTPGDTSMVSVDEVKKLVLNPSARVAR